MGIFEFAQRMNIDMTQFTHGHALVIGIGADLPNTVDDAVGLADILKDPERCAYPPGQVRMLTGPEATRAAVLDGLAALKARSNDEATVIVFFSGHGYQVQTAIGTQYFLMPYGYRGDNLPGTAVSGGELSDALRAIPARRLLLLLDCCHAGGLDDIKAPGVTFTKSPIPAEAVEALAGGRGWAGKLPAGRVPAAILALTVALALFLSPMAASERLRGTLSLEPGSTAYIRLRLWQSAVAMVIDHPWTGVGPDNFLYAYRDRYVQRDVVQERSLSHAHNLLLDWATRLGLPGLSIGLLLLGSSVWALRQAARAPRLMQDHRVWLWGLIGMQAYSLAHGLVDNHFFLVDLAAAQWLLLAAARSLAQAGADAPQPSFTDRRT